MFVLCIDTLILNINTLHNAHGFAYWIAVHCLATLETWLEIHERLRGPKVTKSKVRCDSNWKK